MNWKKVIYIGIFFCMAVLMQEPLVPDTAAIAAAESEQTDFLLPDDGSGQDCQFNDEAITPLPANAITGRHNTSNSLARVLNTRRIQARNALLAESVCSSVTFRPGNFITGNAVLYPSGLQSSIHHLIRLRKLIC